MLGLPSTTEVSVRLPKEAFYRNLKLDAKLREQFVAGVESITVANTIKPATANVIDGKKVHEILVVAVEPRDGEIPEAVIRVIVGANQNMVIVVDPSSSKVSLEHDGDLCVSQLASLELHGRSLDDMWDSILAQVVFGDSKGSGIEERIIRKRQAEKLSAEIAKIESKARKEKQLRKKNELIAQARKLRDSYMRHYCSGEVR